VGELQLLQAGGGLAAEAGKAPGEVVSAGVARIELDCVVEGSDRVGHLAPLVVDEAECSLQDGVVGVFGDELVGDGESFIKLAAADVRDEAFEWRSKAGWRLQLSNGGCCLGVCGGDAGGNLCGFRGG